MFSPSSRTTMKHSLWEQRSSRKVEECPAFLENYIVTTSVSLSTVCIHFTWHLQFLQGYPHVGQHQLFLRVPALLFCRVLSGLGFGSWGAALAESLGGLCALSFSLLASPLVFLLAMVVAAVSCGYRDAAWALVWWDHSHISTHLLYGIVVHYVRVQ